MLPYLYIAKIKIKSALVYQFNVVFTIMLQSIILFANAFFWIAIYGGKSTAMGVSQSSMLSYVVMSAFIGSLFTHEVEERIIRSVRKGNIALDMLKPVNLFGIFLAEDIGGIFVALLQRALPLLVLSCLFIQVPVPASGLHLLLFLASFILSYAINWLFAAIFGMWAFTAISLGPMRSVKNHLVIMLSGSIVPLWFFPDWLKNALELLPFPYIYQLPLSIFIGRYDVNILLYQMMIQGVWVCPFVFAFHIYKKTSCWQSHGAGGVIWIVSNTIILWVHCT